LQEAAPPIPDIGDNVSSNAIFIAAEGIWFQITWIGL
jgi:hypothetical protein